MPKFRIEPPYYPIVYVRGYAMRSGEREETFHDAYYGFSATSVEKRQAPPPTYLEADLFEGQFIRLLKDHDYVDAVNRGLDIAVSRTPASNRDNPSRSVWICRFYDQDFLKEKLRSIEEHARDLRDLICNTIPARLKEVGVNLGRNDKDYRVILLAHSMGGLVCRTMIQNILPFEDKRDPKDWVHRLVTMGTPHRGIDLGRIPDFLEDLVTSKLNPFDANIFREGRMREYLKLSNPDYDVHSLGDPAAPFAFPVKRCFTLIGSDYKSYGLVREATGSFSDGLVKQDRAYVVTGPKPSTGADYLAENKCYWANVHRAHSGYRGIVNSFESFENVQRFLFGDVRAEIWLEKIMAPNVPAAGIKCFYDLECVFSIRKTQAYLHQCQQDPCGNARRFKETALPSSVLLHTGFMNSALRDSGSAFSHFAIKIRVVEHQVHDGLLWDTEYPERPIYNEMVEVRVGDEDAAQPGNQVQYRWMSDGDEWHPSVADSTGFRFPLRAASSFSADLVLRVGPWPDATLTKEL